MGEIDQTSHPGGPEATGLPDSQKETVAFEKGRREQGTKEGAYAITAVLHVKRS